MKLPPTMLGFLVLAAGSAAAQDVEIVAELMNRIGTDSSHKGDLISARVISPATLQNDILEGNVTNSKAGGKIGGHSVLTFSFETLRHGGQAIPVSTQVRTVTNSKGQMNADEEGRVVRGSNGNLGKVAGATGAGALIGGIAGGGKGAAIGAGAGAVAGIVVIEVAAEGPNIRLDPGSRVTLLAKSRREPSLASLPANSTPAPVSQPAPVAAAPAPAPVVAAQAAQGVAPAAAPPAASASTVSAQPDLTAIKADFVPGEKVVVFDDFSDMAGDEPPPHWKVRGGTPVLKVGGGVRQLTIDARTATLTANCSGVPANFTFEVDLKYEKPNRDFVHWWFRSKAKDGGEILHLMTMAQYGNVHWQLQAGPEQLGQGDFKSSFTEPERLALWVQNGRIRFYANGNRLTDVNQVKLAPIQFFEMEVSNQGDGTDAIGIRNVRLAESTPDFSQMISSSGRYVTHGILFDTDSDRLKPESAPVIKMIARGLETNAALKLLIEGHTDSTGNADHNLDLSRRRAESVKSILISQFSVDASRLNASGLGATKPIDSNDTPQGRTQNRRVEFVRQ